MRGPAASLLALALLFGLICIAVWAIVLPARHTLIVADARIAELTDQIEAFAARLNSAETSERVQVGDQALLPGDSPALAAAALQEQLENAARTTGTSIARVTIDPPEADGALSVVSVNIEIIATIRELGRFLREVEGGRPYLVVSELRLRRLPLSDDTEPRLATTMRISGFSEG